MLYFKGTTEQHAEIFRPNITLKNNVDNTAPELGL